MLSSVKVTYNYLNGPILHSLMIDLLWEAVKGHFKSSVLEEMDGQAQCLLTVRCMLN